MLTALAASLSSCSDDTLASISETVFAPSRLFNSASAACARLLCRSCNALSMHATDVSRPPRRTRRGPRASPLFGLCLHRSSPRKRLDFVARLPFLLVAQAKLFQRIYFPHDAFFKDMALRPNVMKSSGVSLTRCETSQLRWCFSLKTYHISRTGASPACISWKYPPKSHFLGILALFLFQFNERPNHPLNVLGLETCPNSQLKLHARSLAPCV